VKKFGMKEESGHKLTRNKSILYRVLSEVVKELKIYETPIPE
jgi:hypothetical protein